MNRRLDHAWIWIGVTAGILPYFGLAQPPQVSLEVLSIFFGGLLAIASILPATKDYDKMKEIIGSGHIHDLVSYIILPLWCSFILILLEVIRASLPTLPTWIPVWLAQSIVLAIWGVFILSLARLLLLVPHMLTDRK